MKSPLQRVQLLALKAHDRGAVPRTGFETDETVRKYVQVTPFLVLAIGVDNMFLLAQLEANLAGIFDVRDRIQACLGAAGPSIALASLCEVLAFAVAAATPMPAVRSFAIVAAVAVLLDFLLQLTAFVAFLSLTSERRRDGTLVCFQCWRPTSPEGPMTPLIRNFQVRMPDASSV